MLSFEFTAYLISNFENSYEGIEHIYIRDFLSSSLTPKML